MKKAKGQTVDLLYTNKKETNKTQNKKRKNTSKKGKKSSQNKNNQRIDLDNEIIIGLTPKKEEVKRSKNVKSSTKNKPVTKKKEKKPNKKTTKQKKKKDLKFVKWVIIFMLFVTTVILFMMSSIFNIKQIIVVNNSKISSEQIIELSKLTLDINMFKTTNGTIRNNIKQNAYIEDVKIKRNINGTVTLDIKERRPSYMLKFANAYVYINNQGYMLEVSEEPLELPTIIGFSTANEEIKAGNRLNIEDLNKLNDILKIMESSKNSPLANIITEIDITNSNNYKLTIASEEKTIKFGDLSNINIKLQMAGQVINNEKGKKGEIYFQDNSKKAVFKEEVSR